MEELLGVFSKIFVSFFFLLEFDNHLGTYHMTKGSQICKILQ